MEIRTCKNCKIEKSLNDFRRRIIVKGKSYFSHKCKKCEYEWNQTYHKQVFTKDPIKRKKIYARQRKNILSRRAENRNLKIRLMNAIEQSKCLHCNFADDRGLVFHHRNPKEKAFQIARGISCSYSFERLLTEAKKCDVLCQNCHLKHHAVSNSKRSQKYTQNKYQILADLQKTSCEECNLTDLRCLTFHHKDRATKNFEIPIGLHRYSYAKNLEEARKCQILCHNCHHILHAIEREELRQI